MAISQMKMMHTLIQANVNTDGLKPDEIRYEYNRHMLNSAPQQQPASDVDESPTAHYKEPQQQPASDVDGLAQLLLTSGLDAFKQATQAHIDNLTPIKTGVDHIRTRTITVDENGDEVETKPHDIQFQGLEPLGPLLGVDQLSNTVLVPVANDARRAPNLDYDFQPFFDAGSLEPIAAMIRIEENTWLYGQKATGKTTFVQEIAARTNRPFFRIQHSKSMEPQDLIGQLQIPNGNSIWCDGLLLQAIKTPYAVILFDEPTVNPMACEMYQTMLDERYIDVALTGERVYIAEGVNFFAADNTNGHGDETGMYDGTMTVNTAFLDRFKIKIEVGYMSFASEAALLEKKGLTSGQAFMMAKYAAAIRHSDDISEPISLRRLLAFTSLVVADVDHDVAMQCAIFSHVRHAQDQEAYRQIAAATLTNIHFV